MCKFLLLSLCLVYLILWIGLGTTATMSLPLLGSPADIILPDGTNLAILLVILVVWDPGEGVGTYSYGIGNG